MEGNDGSPKKLNEEDKGVVKEMDVEMTDDVTQTSSSRSLDGENSVGEVTFESNGGSMAMSLAEMIQQKVGEKLGKLEEHMSGAGPSSQIHFNLISQPLMGEFMLEPTFLSERRNKRKYGIQDAPSRIPIFTKNDVVAFLDEDRVALAKVVETVANTNGLYQRSAMGRDVVMGKNVNIHTIPDDQQDEIANAKILVLDRGVHLGETVGWAKFTHLQMGNNSWNEKGWQQIHTGPTGIVMEQEVFGDILLLPDKKKVLRDVNLLDCDPTTMTINRPRRLNDRNVYIGGNVHPRETTLIVYEGWLGEVQSQMDRIWLRYEDNYTVNFAYSPDQTLPIQLSRADGSSEKKRLVPGEWVSVRLRELLTTSVEWSPSPSAPSELHSLTRGIKGRKHMVKCEVIKVEADVLQVTWKRPVGMGSDTRAFRPPVEIKGEDISKIQVIHRRRLPRAGDRITIAARVFRACFECEWEEYEDCLHNTYKEYIPKVVSSSEPAPTPNTTTNRPYYSRTKCARMRNLTGVGGAARVQPIDEPIESAHFDPPEFLPRIDTPKRDIDDYSEPLIGEILNTRTKVSVLWVDGTVSERVDGRLLAPVSEKDQGTHANMIGVSPLFPGNIVQKKIDRKPSRGSFGGFWGMEPRSQQKREDGQFGVVLSVDDAERFVKVQWLTVAEGKVTNVGEEEECTLFDIVLAPIDYKLLPGRLGMLTVPRGKSLMENAFIMGAMLPDGKRIVRFLNGQKEALWPVEMKSLARAAGSFSNVSNAIGVWDNGWSMDWQADGTLLGGMNMGGQEGLVQQIKNKKEKLDAMKQKMDLLKSKIEQSGTSSTVVQSAEERFQQAQQAHHAAAVSQMKKMMQYHSNGMNQAAAVYNQPNPNPMETFKEHLENMTQMSNDAFHKLKAEQETVGKLSTSLEMYSKKRAKDVEALEKEAKEAAKEMDWNDLLPSSSSVPSASSSLNINPPSSSSVGDNSVNVLAAGIASTDVNMDNKDLPVCSNPSLLNKVYKPKAVPVHILAYEGEVDVLSDPESFEDIKPFSLEMDSGDSLSNVMDGEVLEDLAVLCTAAQLAHPTSGLAAEAKKMAEKWSNKAGPSSAPTFDAMERLVKLNERYQIEPAVSLPALRQKLTDAEKGVLHFEEAETKDEFLSDMGKIVNMRNANRVLCTLERAMASSPLPLSEQTNLGVVSSNGTETAQTPNTMDGNSRDAELVVTPPPLRDNENGESLDIGREEEVGTKEEGTTQIVQTHSFEMVPHCSSHKWLHDSSVGGSDFLRAVRKEHKLLADLPEGLYVRTYEDRLDLLNAIIVGPRGTPFDSAPFFFEIKLPEEYPNKPPRVNFAAFSSEALNPNLYQEGKVCLSLLGTWSGKQSEKWNPKISNLQQVLISIQALILNAEPYWNEPGREHSKNDPVQMNASQRYNESTTINSVQYMERIYAQPPTSFEQLIRQIVKERIYDYRCRVDSWFLSGESSSLPDFPLPRLSKGFQVALKNGLSRVQSAVDADISRLEDKEKKNEEKEKKEGEQGSSK